MLSSVTLSRNLTDHDPAFRLLEYSSPISPQNLDRTMLPIGTGAGAVGSGRPSGRRHDQPQQQLHHPHQLKQQQHHHQPQQQDPARLQSQSQPQPSFHLQNFSHPSFANVYHPQPQTQMHIPDSPWNSDTKIPNVQEVRPWPQIAAVPAAPPTWSNPETRDATPSTTTTPARLSPTASIIRSSPVAGPFPSDYYPSLPVVPGMLAAEMKSPALSPHHFPAQQQQALLGDVTVQTGGPHRRSSGRDEFDGPHQLLPKPADSHVEVSEAELVQLPMSLYAEEQDSILSRVNDCLSMCAFAFVAKYQFPIPLEAERRPVRVPGDREWTEWCYLLKRLATKRRIPARVLYNGQIKQFVTVLENSLEMRHAAKQQSRPLKDDRNVLQLISAALQVAKMLKDPAAMAFLDELYRSTETVIAGRRGHRQQSTTPSPPPSMDMLRLSNSLSISA